MGKNIVNIVICWIAALAIIFGYYVSVSNGLTSTPFYLQLRRFIPMALAIVLAVFFLYKRVHGTYWLTFTVVGILWAVVYPVPYWFFYHETVPYFSTHHDLAFAGYSFVGSSLMGYFLTKFCGVVIASFLVSSLQWVVMLPILFQVMYLVYYGTVITNPAILAVWQTTPAEAKEYVLAVGGYGGAIIIFAGVLLLWFIFFKFNRCNFEKITFECRFDSGRQFYVSALTLVLCVATLGYSMMSGLRKTCIVEMCVDVKQYFDNVREFAGIHKQSYSKFTVSPVMSRAKPRGTILVVIGESASRHFMSAWGYNKDTTPWLKKQRHSSEFFYFENAKACAGQTVAALEQALTEKNMSNNVEFKECISIVDLARKSGYRTYWFSNQSRIDESSTPVTLVAETADIAKWTNVDSDSWQYDGQLLDLLKHVDSKTPNFVVLHLIGSHAEFSNRFPNSFAKSVGEATGNYELSLMYTDENLRRFFEYCKKNLNLQVMIYFSDHGCVPKDKRRVEEMRSAHFDIPYVVYLSDRYQKEFPEFIKNLRLRLESVFTNDLTFELVRDVLGIRIKKVR